MGRIRTIKPEFPQSESIGNLSRDARLLFVQIWTLVDDDGRCRASSRMLASLLYPYDDDAPALIGDWLDELVHKGCVRLYEVEGAHYLDIPKWLDHQKIDHPKGSKHPAFRDENKSLATPRDASRISAPDLDQGPRTKEGTKDQDHIRTVAVATRPDDRQKFEEFWKAYPNRDGANPRKPALKAFLAALKRGNTPQAIIVATEKFRIQERGKGREGSTFVPQAVTWLQQDRFLDSNADPPAVTSHVTKPGMSNWRPWREEYQRSGNKFALHRLTEIENGLSKDDWWPVPSEYPPDFKLEAAE